MPVPLALPGPGLFPRSVEQIEFEAVLISADPKAGSMRVDWRILGEKNSQCRADNLGACTEVNVFFDTYVRGLLIFRQNSCLKVLWPLEISLGRTAHIRHRKRSFQTTGPRGLCSSITPRRLLSPTSPLVSQHSARSSHSFLQTPIIRVCCFTHLTGKMLNYFFFLARGLTKS